MVLLTFLFTSCQGRQSTAATEGQKNTVAGRQLAAASPVNKLDDALVLYAGSPMALINYAKVPIDPENPKVRPFSRDAAVFAPVRFVAESLGGKVTWDQASRTATIAADGKTIKLSPDSTVMYVDATPVNLDFPVMGENGRILVPVNQFAEAMGRQVFYDRGLIVITKVKNLLDKNSG
jgi:Copper amine oxidase N-terminal domain.